MAIQKTIGFKASDGTVYGTIEEAQTAEFRSLLGEVDGGTSVPEEALTMLANDLPNHAEAILAILTTGPKSRPGARKSKATSNPKRAAAKATPRQALEGFQKMRVAANGAAPVGHDDVCVAGILPAKL